MSPVFLLCSDSEHDTDGHKIILIHLRGFRLTNSYASGNETCEYDVANDEGIAVEADDFPGINAKLVLVPGPTRLILQGQTVPFKETVWIASEN